MNITRVKGLPQGRLLESSRQFHQFRPREGTAGSRNQWPETLLAEERFSRLRAEPQIGPNRNHGSESHAGAGREREPEGVGPITASTEVPAAGQALASLATKCSPARFRPPEFGRTERPSEKGNCHGGATRPRVKWKNKANFAESQDRNKALVLANKILGLVTQICCDEAGRLAKRQIIQG